MQEIDCPTTEIRVYRIEDIPPHFSLFRAHFNHLQAKKNIETESKWKRGRRAMPTNYNSILVNAENIIEKSTRKMHRCILTILRKIRASFHSLGKFEAQKSEISKINYVLHLLRRIRCAERGREKKGIGFYFSLSSTCIQCAGLPAE